MPAPPGVPNSDSPACRLYRGGPSALPLRPAPGVVEKAMRDANARASADTIIEVGHTPMFFCWEVQTNDFCQRTGMSQGHEFRGLLG